MTVSIEELLRALQDPNKPSTLENNSDTWRRIGEKDSFSELGLEGGELEGFLKEWAMENPYSNI